MYIIDLIHLIVQSSMIRMHMYAFSNVYIPEWSVAAGRLFFTLIALAQKGLDYFGQIFLWSCPLISILLVRQIISNRSSCTM